MSGCVLALLAASQPPAAARKPVATSYHGVRVVDDYRWLEPWKNPAVQKFTVKPPGKPSLQRGTSWAYPAYRSSMWRT